MVTETLTMTQQQPQEQQQNGNNTTGARDNNGNNNDGDDDVNATTEQQLENRGSTLNDRAENDVLCAEEQQQQQQQALDQPPSPAVAAASGLPPATPPADTTTAAGNPPCDSLSSQRVFKKSSANNKLTLYLSSRDLVVSEGRIDRLQGVLLVDPEFVENRKVYGQVTLTFRYGREDEEVMGLKFCNEAIMCLAQLYPPPQLQGQQQELLQESNTPLQEALIKRLGPNAYPFHMEITPLAPPSVQLVPAKEYHGAPIGTSYDIRAYIAAEKGEEKQHKRTTVRMGIRVVQRAYAPPSPYLYTPGGGGNESKSNHHHHHRKILLFGCKSTPMDMKFKNNDSRPKGGGAVAAAAPAPPLTEKGPNNGGGGRKDDDDKGGGGGGVVEGCAGNGNGNGDTPKTTVHVSFREEQLLTNGKCSNGKDTNGGGGGGGGGNINIERQQCTVPEDGGNLSLDNGGGQHRETVEKDAQEPSNRQINIEVGDGGGGGDGGGNDDGDRTTTAVADKEDNQMVEDFHSSLCGGKRPSLAAYLAGVPPPTASIEKQFLLSDGKVYLSATLDKAIYSHGEEIHVTVKIVNNSSKTVKRIKVFVVQHVDVCMFSNGKFKNVVAMTNDKDDCPLHSGHRLTKTYSLLPIKSATKNWIALEDSYTKSGTSLASTVTSTGDNPDERNVFAIYVSYYVKVKLMVSVMGGDVCLKLPFTLMHTCTDFEHTETLTRIRPHALAQPPCADTDSPSQDTPMQGVELNLASAIKQEKDGT